jgi:hypothetical protein
MVVDGWVPDPDLDPRGQKTYRLVLFWRHKIIMLIAYAESHLIYSRNK